MVARHYLVTGRVQGVGFRNFTQSRALYLELKGLVRNLRDGRVEILATGTSEAIGEFSNAIAKGPQLSRVTDVIEREPQGRAADLLASSKDFRVASDGEGPWSEEL